MGLHCVLVDYESALCSARQQIMLGSGPQLAGQSQSKGKGVTVEMKTCHACGEKGHFVRNCIKRKKIINEEIREGISQ